MKIKYLKSPILLLPVAFIINIALLADLSQADSSQDLQTENNSQVQVAPAVQPTLDPRLPAVLPGEEVSRSGKQIKVWSTGGSPSVNTEAPTAPVAGSSGDQWKIGDGHDDLSVIVDGRDLLPGDRGPRR